MGRRRGTSMFSPYRDEIIRLLDEGKNVKQIFRILFPEPDSGYQYQTFLGYVNSNGLRFITDNKGYEEVPLCKLCKSMVSIKRCERDKCDIAVCLSEKREIGPHRITSPKWCPKRDKKRQGEV